MRSQELKKFRVINSRFHSPDKSVASEARTFTHVLFDAARVMFKELQRRKDGLYFKRMHILLKTQLTPWVVTLGKSADNKKRVKTRWQFMYRLLWQGITFVLKNNTMKDVRNSYGCNCVGICVSYAYGERNERDVDSTIPFGVRRCCVVSQRDPKLQTTIWKCLKRCLREESSRHLQMERKIQTISSRRNGSIGFCSCVVSQ